MNVLNEIRQPAVLFNRHNEHVQDMQPQSEIVLNILMSNFTHCLLFEDVTVFKMIAKI